MTNLFDFLDDWDSGMNIIVESKDEIVYSGSISSFDEEKANKYWVVKGSVKLINEITHIFVENEEELNKKIEEQNGKSFQAIWEAILKDSRKGEESIYSFSKLVKSAKEYVYYRKNWDQFPIEMLGKYDRERSLSHDIFIAELDSFFCQVENKIGAKVPWRNALGNERDHLGEFAEYIMDTISNVKERVEIVEAIIWAQDHRNQILHCVEESIDDADARRRITELFNFNFNQAQAIIDMRVRVFNKTGRVKMQEELVKLLEKARPYEEWL